MANKLIHYNNKLNFELDKDSITEHSIVFIQDSKEISTHGTVYKTVNWSVLEAFIFYIDDFEYRFDQGMNFYDFANSEYNNNEYYYVQVGLDNTVMIRYDKGELLYEDGTIVNLQDPIQEGIIYYFNKPLP